MAPDRPGTAAVGISKSGRALRADHVFPHAYVFLFASTNPMIPPAYLVGTAAVTENLLKRKWSAIILRHLAAGINDPSEICKKELGISMPAMNERLRNMIRFCLITRYPRASPSKIVEYRLTARGQKVLKILNFIDQLDQEMNDKDEAEDEKILVTVRRTKVSPADKKRIVLIESTKPTNQTSADKIRLIS